MMPILFLKDTLPFTTFSLFIPLLFCAMMLYFFAQQTDANDVANPQKGSTNRKTKTGTIHEGQFQQQKEIFTLCNFKI